MFAASFEHPAAGALLELLEDPGTLATGAPDASSVLGRLVTLGAPLLGASTPESQVVDWHPLEVTVVEGVELARHDATVARSLPLVVARILRHLRLPTTPPPVAPARSRALQAELIDDLENDADVDVDAFTEHGDPLQGFTPLCSASRSSLTLRRRRCDFAALPRPAPHRTAAEPEPEPEP